MNNDAVNFASSVFGALVAAGLTHRLNDHVMKCRDVTRLGWKGEVQ